MLIDNFTVKSPNVTYTDEHIESTYTCVRHPDVPRDGSRGASPSHTPPRASPFATFATFLSAETKSRTDRRVFFTH